MSTRTRKGFFRNKVLSDQDYSIEFPVTKIAIPNHSYRGSNLVDRNDSKLSNATNNQPLLRKYRTGIYLEFIDNKSKNTIKTNMGILRRIQTYLNNYSTLHKVKIEEPSDLSRDITHGFGDLVQKYSSPSQSTNIFNRLLKVIGVPPALLLPPNYSTNQKAPKESSSLSGLRKALKLAKQDHELMRKRLREFDELTSTGRDPRTLGPLGWSRPENRLWFVQNVIGTHIPTFGALKKNPAISPYLHKLQQYPGAPSFDDDGNSVSEKGYAAHVNWLYPRAKDLLPCIALLLLRTPLNLSSILDAQIEEDWYSPYPFNFSANGKDFAYVNFRKVRGRQDALAEPTTVSVISPINVYSYPYQVHLFLQSFTKATRVEIKRQIEELSADPRNNYDEILRLKSIVNDLFVYRGKLGFNSLRAVSAGSIPANIRHHFDRYGLKAGQTRGNNLSTAYNFSGQNLLIIHILAFHGDKNLSILYSRRSAAIKESELLFRNIFDLSMQLISIDMFDAANLSIILEAQGFNQKEVSNLLDWDNRTRWGNRCSNPAAPPPGFGDVLIPGQLCRSQNCIDGCSNARWFNEDMSGVQSLLSDLKEKASIFGLGSAHVGALHSKIERLEGILLAIGSLS